MGAKLKSTGNSSNAQGMTQASSMTQGDRDKRRRQEGNVGKEFQTIDFNTFDISVLRKYARVHNLKVASLTNKEELVAAVSRHFANQSVKEIDTITCFLYTAHYRDSVLRLPLQM